MTFQTIYDIRQAGCRDGFLPFAFAAIAIIALVARQNRFAAALRVPLPNLPKKPALPPAAGFVFFLALALLAFATTWGSYWSLIGTLRTGRASEIVGRITQFEPAAYYKDPERFTVDGRTFTYEKFAVSQGFHTLRMYGNPLRDGATVRVTFVGNHILKLELAR